MTKRVLNARIDSVLYSVCAHRAKEKGVSLTKFVVEALNAATRIHPTGCRVDPSACHQDIALQPSSSDLPELTLDESSVGYTELETEKRLANDENAERIKREAAERRTAAGGPADDLPF